ncbi:MAG TPA: energy transducer TonB [Pyrinomonadaceae bacterium]|nr:energy transducer TonB [Pyrinomonadaceae bacterium]
MQKVILPMIWCIACAGAVICQANSAAVERSVTGIAKDRSGLPIVGLDLFVERDDFRRVFSTDHKGEFELKLKPADYVLTVGGHIKRDFRLFLKVPDSGPVARDLELMFDPSTTCCSDIDGKPYPKPTSLPKPPFPPAARAVRASGEVAVEVVLATDGSVETASAISGHPLLRRAAEAAAMRALFENSGKITSKRLLLVYVFLLSDPEPERQRYSNPYRIEVRSLYEIVAN